MKNPVSPGKQDSIVVHSRTQRYQAFTLPTEEENIFMISTAKKSSVAPKSVCPACGARTDRHEVTPCRFCGIELCAACYEQARQRCQDREQEEEE